MSENTATKEKNVLKRFRQWLGKMLDDHPVILTVCLAFLITFVVEILSRHSLIKACIFLGTHPIRFVVNFAMVLFTLSISFFFRKRSFFIVLFSAIWLSLGIVNCVLLGFRTTPFGMIDILLLSSVFSIINVYLNTFQIVLLCVAIVAVITGLVVMFIRSKKRKVNFKRAIVAFLIAAVLAGGTYGVTVIGREEDRAESFANISQAYKDYGFVYCFSTGAVDRGISQPKNYSKGAIKKITSSLPEVEEPEETPDIIMIQLESFYDIKYLDDVNYADDPIPVFTELKKNYSTGFLTVPSVGAGTANTEFEVLSGMSLDYFGMGEYPYKTVLKKEACETVATNLREMGYKSHALHNNTGTFYGRNVVYAQLGFDTFTSLEYMNDVTYNPIGWANDIVLKDEILKALDSTEEQDFVFAITVQGHGKYQNGTTSEQAEDTDVEWIDNPNSEDAFAYYVSQLTETDKFVGELIDALEERGEPTVLVLYGDHLPNFDIGSEHIKDGDLFQTEYVIWDNFGMAKQDKDLNAYQLYSEVLARLGMNEGILTRFHQNCSENSNYLKNLELLEYDMLYGEYYCYGGDNPYTATDLQMGTEPIEITDAIWKDGTLYVYGNNFTQWSSVCINGDSEKTTFENAGLIYIECDEPESEDVITVRQLAAGGVPLSETDGFIW
jgi:phosphoglycerol transferase MdoB-like AlkP superfamily enzyme